MEFLLYSTKIYLSYRRYRRSADVSVVLLHCTGQCNPDIENQEQEKKVRDKEEKEKTIKLYNTLLNSLSHELRTPISTVIGAVDTLKENKEELTEANQTELLQQIGDAVSGSTNRWKIC